MSQTPTDKQIAFAISLLGQAGYNTEFMNAQFKNLGATMSQRSGTVRNWLTRMNRKEISDLIDQLKS